MRRAWLTPFLVIAFVPGWTGAERLPLLGKRAHVEAQVLPRLAADTDRDRIGALEYVGGVRLRSRDPAFGGFSAMHVVGDRFTLLSDGGNIVRFRMGPGWRIGDAAFDDLGEGPRTGWRKRDRDSEAMAVDPETGRVWIAFENANAIWRYTPDLKRAGGHVQPRVMRDWPENGGAESLVRLPDGRFVALSEYVSRGAPEGSYHAIRFDGDPVEAGTRSERFFHRPPAGFNPTDAAMLPDGRLIVVHRRVGWPEGFEAALTILDPRAIRAGKVIEGHEIARFHGGLRNGFGRDNFEAVAVTREGRDTMIWLATDDNLQWPQRSLLLKFRLVLDGLEAQ